MKFKSVERALRFFYFICSKHFPVATSGNTEVSPVLKLSELVRASHIS